MSPGAAVAHPLPLPRHPTPSGTEVLSGQSGGLEKRRVTTHMDGRGLGVNTDTVACWLENRKDQHLLHVYTEHFNSLLRKKLSMPAEITTFWLGGDESKDQMAKTKRQKQQKKVVLKVTLCSIYPDVMFDLVTVTSLKWYPYCYCLHSLLMLANNNTPRHSLCAKTTRLQVQVASYCQYDYD